MAIAGEGKYQLKGIYGKQSVPVFKIRKLGARHEVVDLMVKILLEGDVHDSWLTGDNHQILPTDTQKNTCYIAALNTDYDSGEAYGVALGRDILGRHAHISCVQLEVEERPWERVRIAGKEHNHAFIQSRDPHKITCNLRVPRNGSVEVTSGVREISLMKTTQSAFEGYIVDKYTTLEPVGPGSDNPDRIMCTEMNARWRYTSAAASPASTDFKAVNADVLRLLIEEFGGPADTGRFSKSLQETANRMAVRVLDDRPEIEEVKLVTPNIHHFRAGLEPFGLANPNVVFQTTDLRTSASGHIITQMSRKGASAKL